MFKKGDKIKSLECNIGIMMGEVFIVDGAKHGMVFFKDSEGHARQKYASNYVLVKELRDLFNDMFKD